MKEVIVVFLGGGLGSLTRFGLSRWINSLHNSHFPLGTFFVNIIACLALGFIIGLADHKQILSQTTRLFFTVGFCGGFSTYSAFSSETLTLFQQGYTFNAVLYVVLSVVFSVAATLGGLVIAHRI